MAVQRYAPPPKEDLLAAAERHLGLANYRTARDLFRDVLQSPTSDQRRELAQNGVQRANEHFRAQCHESRAFTVT